MIAKIFHDAAGNSLDALPVAIKLETSYSKFCDGVKKFLTERAKNLS